MNNTSGIVKTHRKYFLEKNRKEIEIKKHKILILRHLTIFLLLIKQYKIKQ